MSQGFQERGLLKGHGRRIGVLKKMEESCLVVHKIKVGLRTTLRTLVTSQNGPPER